MARAEPKWGFLKSPAISAHQLKPRDWRRRMSDNVAYALWAYTGLQIFMTLAILKGPGGSILPYFALVVLIMAVLPGFQSR